MSTLPPSPDIVRERVDSLRALIHDLRGDPRAVRIIAVTKTFDASALDVAAEAGCDAIGENYAQELLGKLPLRTGAVRLPVHFIGRLQSNKVKALFPHVDLWHTVDRPSLISALGKEARAAGTTPRILIQVNSTGEDQKSGCTPADAAVLVDGAREAGLEVVGLMTMGPSDADPVVTRHSFRVVATLARQLGLAELSMGMTHDVRIAIEEGATMVRIGSGLFGDRPHSARGTRIA